MDYFFAKFQKAFNGLHECASQVATCQEDLALGRGRGLAGESEIDRRCVFKLQSIGR